MAKIQFPADPVATPSFTHNGKKLDYVNGAWVVAPQFTADAGGGGGVDETAVNALIDTKITQLDVGGQITEAIEGLELGTMSKSDLIVSTAAPDPAVGSNGDIWLQIPA